MNKLLVYIRLYHMRILKLIMGRKTYVYRVVSMVRDRVGGLNCI